MRQHRRKLFALGGVTILVALAVTLAFAAGGRAASPSICAVDSTDTTPASCVTETLGPHSAVAGSPQLSIAKFTNQSDGGATASHTSITTTFSVPVNVQSVLLVVNGVRQASSSCTPQSGSTATVSCSDVGSTSGGSFDKVIVQFTTVGAGSVDASAFVTYGESGNDNSVGPNGTANDRQTSNTDTATVYASGTVKGDCTPSGGNTGFIGDSTLSTQLIYTAAADAFLPCTPVTAGVLPGNSNTHTSIAVVDFPELGSTPGLTACPTSGGQTFCYAIATLNFAVVPKGENAKNFVLYEALPPAFDFTNKITVPACQTNGLPPNPATTPAAGPPQQNDTCVSATGNLPKGGVQVVLHAIASPFDGHYSG